MANGDTKTEQMLDVLANGGSTAAFKGCCNTKTQNYILDAADRIQAVEDEVERLENNPDVADIVATYADLQAYPTSQLTDKDVIRVLQDETHDGDSTYYRWSTSTSTWTYIGESKQYTNFVGTDGTAAGEAGLVPAPAIADAGKFLKADGTWADAGGGGGAVQLTTADYDYPEGTPDGIALWRLDPGLYNWDNQMKVYTSNATTITTGASAFVTEAAGNAKEYIEVLAFVPSGGVSGTYRWSKVNYSTGAKVNNISNVHFLTDKGVVQTTGTSTTDIMSQKAVTDAIASSGGGEPDYSETEVSTGVKWIDGKTIYKKSYQQTITSNSQTFNLDITNLYEVVKIEAIWHLGGTLTNGLPTTFATSTSMNDAVNVLTYGGQAQISSNGRNGMKGVITFYYTKST